MSKCIKRIDELGRVLLPAEIRKALEIHSKDWIIIALNDNEITIKKFEDSCVFCGSQENLIKLRDKFVCEHCQNHFSQNLLKMIENADIEATKK